MKYFVSCPPALALIFLVMSGAAWAQSDAAKTAMQLFTNKNYAAAIPALSKAIGETPNDAELYYQRGYSYIELGKPIEAYDDLTKAVTLNPKFEDAWTERCYLLMSSTLYAQAIENCSFAIALNPRSSAALNNRGLSKRRMGDEQGAMDDYTAALEIDPGYHEARANRANLFYLMRNFPSAARDAAWLVTNAPQSLGGWVVQAKTANELENYQLGLQASDGALALEPEYRDAMYERAYALNGLDRFEESEKQLDAMLEKDANDADALAERANVRGHRDNHAGALADIERAIVLQPKRGAFYVSRGEVYRVMKEFEKARGDYEQARKLDPAMNKYVVENLAKLPPPTKPTY